jgi:hypothetical protein
LNKLTLEEGIVPLGLRDVTVMNHATNVTGVRVVVSTHIIMSLHVTYYETKLKVAINKSETRYVNWNACLPLSAQLEFHEGNCGRTLYTSLARAS